MISLNPSPGCGRLFNSARIKHKVDIAAIMTLNMNGFDLIGSVNSSVCVDSGRVIGSESSSFSSSCSFSTTAVDNFGSSAADEDAAAAAAAFERKTSPEFSENLPDMIDDWGGAAESSASA